MKTISELMEKKAQAAREKVRELMWTGAEADAVAETAIAGGLPPAEVDTIEAEVAEGKAAIERLRAFDMPALKTAADKSRTARTKADKQLRQAEEALDAAAAEEQEASGKLTEARRAFEETATQVSSGKLPATGLPKLVETILAARTANAEREDLAGKANGLLLEIAKTEPRATALQQEADKLRATKSIEQTADAGGRLRPLADDYAASAATMRKQIEAAKKRVAAMQVEAAAAQDKYDTAAALLPW